MMTTPPAPDSGDPAQPANTASTLGAEHAVLLREVQTRCNAVLDEVAAKRWPGAQLHRLLDYLHVEVLQQVADEEWRLFRTAHQDPQSLARLRAEHLALRQRIAMLTGSGARGARCTLDELADLTRGLRDELREHFVGEQAVLTASTPATASLGGRPHEWYALTDRPVIDLDELPGSEGADAVLGRLLRLDRGERVQLLASSDPRPLWRRLAASDPDGYGFAYLAHGPGQWHVEITRRAGA